MKAKFKHIADEIPKQQLHVSYVEENSGFYIVLNNGIAQTDGFVNCDKCGYYHEKAFFEHKNCDGKLAWDLESKWNEQQVIRETIILLNQILHEDPLLYYTKSYTIIDENVKKVFELMDADSFEILFNKILRESIYERLRISELKKSIVHLEKETIDSRSRIQQLENKIQLLEGNNSNNRIAQLETAFEAKNPNSELKNDFKDFLETNQQIVTDLIKRCIEGQQIGNVSFDLQKIKRTLNIMIDLINFGTDVETVVHTANRRLNNNTLYNTQLHFNLQYDNNGNYLNLDQDTHKKLLNRFEGV
jgi:hypothetical protein